jgi:transcription elongation factor Elf1
VGKRKNRDHIVCTTLGHPTHPNSFLCLNCGESKPLQLPMEVKIFTKHCKAFEMLHEDCLPQQKEETT